MLTTRQILPSNMLCWWTQKSRGLSPAHVEGTRVFCFVLFVRVALLVSACSIRLLHWCRMWLQHVRRLLRIARMCESFCNGYALMTLPYMVGLMLFCCQKKKIPSWHGDRGCGILHCDVFLNSVSLCVPFCNDSFKVLPFSPISALFCRQREEAIHLN